MMLFSFAKCIHIGCIIRPASEGRRARGVPPFSINAGCSGSMQLRDLWAGVARTGEPVQKQPPDSNLTPGSTTDSYHL